MTSIPTDPHCDSILQYPEIEQVLALMNHYDPDPRHALQVGRLSGLIFDLLGDIHNMDSNDRRLLIFAALLHDIGWSVPSYPHHKASMNLILGDETIPINSDDRQIIAMIARYHRKAHPSPMHTAFGLLSPQKRWHVRWLAAILRLADALDRSHTSIVQTMSASCPEGIIQIYCSIRTNASPDPENQVIEKKSALLCEVAERRVNIIWN